MPNVLKTTLSSWATPMPSTRPTVAPTSPMTSASTMTDRVTCRRSAPSARNRAISWLRWATRIENVLRIRKTPTNSAMPAKISRKVVKKPSADSTAEAASASTSSPVRASRPSGSAAATASRSSSAPTPSAAATETVVKASSPARKICWAVAVSKIVRVAPARLPLCPKRATPTSSPVTRGWSVEVITDTSSPSV